MSAGLLPLEVVGTLNPAEAAAFSQDFQNDLGAIPPNQQLISAEDLLLFNGQTEHAGIILPEGHGQFLPAVRIAVEHERRVRGGQRLKDAVLTTRQSIVQPGLSQQGDFGTIAHRDSPFPDALYTVSDTNPTQHYPDVTKDYLGNNIELTVEAAEQGIAFAPFDIVRASTNMYHRSPPVAVPTRRTFMRLVFHYDHAIYY